MSLICRFKGHVPQPGLIWNEGRHFSRCRRCGKEIMRSGRMIWRTTNPGERIEHGSDGLPRLIRGGQA